jgi:hypothetical protein
MKKRVMFNYDDGQLSISGYATVEQFGPECYTLKICDNTFLNNDSDRIEDYLVHIVYNRGKLIGKGGVKFRESIISALAEFDLQVGVL